jgi:hypothetical protein
MEPKPAITYDFNGVKHIQQGHNFRAISGDEFAVFEVLKTLEAQGNWAEVRDLCEVQILKTPEWLTPYLCAGVAHANLGNVEDAIGRQSRLFGSIENPERTAQRARSLSCQEKLSYGTKSDFVEQFAGTDP